MSIVLDGTTGITTPDIDSTVSTLGPLTQALNLGSTGQIVFPATQNASSNANTLDDYEEGTWTGAISGLTVGQSDFSTYTKIGNTVFIRAHLDVSGSPGGTFTITGLPFTSNASNRAAAVIVVQDASASFDQKTGPTMLVGDSSTSLSVNLQGAITLANGDRLNLFASYFV